MNDNNLYFQENASELNSQASTWFDSQRESGDMAASPDSDPSNQSENILPATFYAPSSLFPTSVTNKIDLSSSVSQYLKKDKDSVQKTDSYNSQGDSGFNATEPLGGECL